MLKKIKKLLEEGKIEEADKLFAEHMAAEVKGLKTKNEELLGDVKKRKEENADITKRLEAIEEDKHKTELEAAGKKGDIDAIRKSLETEHAKAVEALITENSGLKGQLNKHVIGEGLTQALVKAKVQPALMDAAKALIQSNFKGEVGDNDGTPFAKFDGKTVEDFVTGWAGTESGKHFVSAENNSGGGSNGASGSGEASDGKGKTMTRSNFDAMNATDKMAASKEGVTLTDE